MAVASEVSLSKSSSIHPPVQKPKVMKSKESPRSQHLALEARKADDMRPNSLRVVKVQDIVFKLPYSFFEQMPIEIREAIFQHNRGISLDDPAVLEGPTVDQFKTLLWAHFTYPSLSLKSLTLDRLLTIAELSYRYRLKHLMAWAIHGLAFVTHHTDTPFRSAPSEAFVRMLNIAIKYHQKELSTAIQNKWMTRIHWQEVSPIPAILLADAYNLRTLLTHAYYVYLVLMEPRIAKSLRIDIECPLSPKQIKHVYCGYYSLRAYWWNLRRTAPEFIRSEECSELHSQCIEVWRRRWAVAGSRAYPSSDINILSRLMSIQQTLEADMLLSVCMTVQCREQAIASISKKRQEIVDNLHHHFDLDL
ncbi:hypothetical protein BDQ17DRAFT_1419303 [Cyathus striatus]|nr:hypothetical protein BDQ17DRAFT_1419303 [Cyathus striatus]